MAPKPKGKLIPLEQAMDLLGGEIFGMAAAAEKDILKPTTLRDIQGVLHLLHKMQQIFVTFYLGANDSLKNAGEKILELEKKNDSLTVSIGVLEKKVKVLEDKEEERIADLRKRVEV